MSGARTIHFGSKDIMLAELAKAIAHPARVAILRLLAERGECICGDLVSELPLAQSTVSQHLKALKEVGLIKGEIDGPRSCYCINWGAMKEFSALSGGFFKNLLKLEMKLGCC